MPEPTRILLWTDTPGPYLDAIAAAGVTGRVGVEALPRTDTPTQAQRADTEAMLAWGVPPGLLPQMRKLRWAQALTAGVEGWLALPDLPPALTLTCARGTHRESMAENIMGGLFHLIKPYAAIVEDQRHSKWTRRLATPLAGQTLGILGLGVIGQQVAQIAATIGMRGSAPSGVPRRSPAWTRCCRPSRRTRCWRRPTSCCCCYPRRPRPTTS
jgi:phosphoglycerate dehydrogenase-like enzyme